MICRYTPIGFWTKEKCLEESIKYKIRADFKRGSVSAYNFSYKNGWLDEFIPKK